jgi:RimJ/RimL family protein N-acetyltransferase
LEVAVLSEVGPFVPVSLARYEATFEQQAWIQGRFHDELLMSVLREEWESVEEP